MSGNVKRPNRNSSSRNAARGASRTPEKKYSRAPERGYSHTSERGYNRTSEQSNRGRKRVPERDSRARTPERGYNRAPEQRRASERGYSRTAERGYKRTAERDRAPERGYDRKSERGRARSDQRAPERGYGRAAESRYRDRAPERKRVQSGSRKRVPERDSRARTPERGYNRAPEQRRASERGYSRTAERGYKRTAGRERAPERGYSRTPGRGRALKQTRVPTRKRPPRGRRAVRRGFGAVVTRLLLLSLVILSLPMLADRLFFRELTVRRFDPMSAETSMTLPAPDESLSPKPSESDDLEAVAPDTIAEAPRKDGFYTILLAGTDDHNGGSDTIILLGVDSRNHRIFGLSIPRDTKAVVNGRPYKMNAAYKIGGMDGLARTISGQMAIPVDHTVEIDLQGFAALVDALGGVEFDVPLDMDYEDPAQDLEIHVSKGVQRLNGETALKVVRFRHNSDGTGYGNEDLGRIQTQQKFLRAAAKKLLSVSSLTRVNDLIRIFQQYVKTDLTLSNLAWLAREGLSVGSDGIEFATLSGTWKSPYIYTDRENALSLINAHLNPYEEDITPDKLKFPD